MLLFDGSLGLIVLVLWLFCLFDVITTDAGSVRNLPKLVWLLIVLVLFDLGAILWLIAGHPWPNRGPARATGPASKYPEYDRPGRFVPTNPDDDEDFLRGLRERAEQQRRDHRARREAELRAEEERLRRRPEDDAAE